MSSLKIRDVIADICTVMLPIFVTQIAIVGMSFFDTVMAGHAGTADLAGVAIGANLWMPVFTGLNGILLALMPIVAQYLGAQQREQISIAVVHGVYVAIFIGLVVVSCLWLTVDDGLTHMGLEADVIRIGSGFLKALSLGMIPIFVCSVLRGFVDTLGYTRLTMCIFAGTLPINIVLNYVLIFGKLGFPALGGIGAGFATATSYSIICLAYFIAIAKVDELNKYQIWSKFGHLQFNLIKEQLRIGVPIGVAIFLESGVFAAMAFFMVKFGTIVIAAHQAAINFTSLLYMLPLSFSLALTILVGIKVGAKEYRAAVLYGRVGIAMNLVIAALFVLLLAVSKEYIASFYSEEPQIIELAAHFLFFAAFFQFLDGTATPIQGILRGYKEVKPAFYASLVAYWGICLPFGYVLDHYFGQGPFSYWQSLITGILVSAVFLVIKLIKLEKRVQKETLF
ncbi:MAG TPA: MATE family efflux transporter [Candidatus Avacidaminococcus intestinavium]|uniref:Probable multidrug resistance protein NorM n=1 Tax=Candidatus Avacidaminococcus intestinavium TaxID=2840684 RepID=A0A9D1MQQ6_9FIRM|nr:MATE family efflux transporter [Candidatus Avacidaminococcus intestinavium]